MENQMSQMKDESIRQLKKRLEFESKRLTDRVGEALEVGLNDRTKGALQTQYTAVKNILKEIEEYPRHYKGETFEHMCERMRRDSADWPAWRKNLFSGKVLKED